MTALPIINRKMAGATWAPHAFRGRMGPRRVMGIVGMARRCFAMFCPEALGLKPEESGRPVIAIWLPIGRQLGPVGLKHGAQAMRLCDALLERFPEFEAVDMDGLAARQPEIIEVFRSHRVIA